ncbi:MAG TPA: alpha/beta hydrolase [Xanthobacteraceae bacterium]|nr:alpha/beta hydrolase [Xanthobacteraceae bacterium]
MTLPEPAPSRRAVLRGLVSVSTLALGGCASLASTGVNSDASELAAHPSLVVATTRKPVKGGRENPWFGPERGSTVTIARARLTPPDEGRFSLSAVGLGDWHIDSVEPAPALGELLAQDGSGRDVLIYVHGYNQTFEMAALDAARLSDSVKFRGETMMFSWPSRAKLLDYGYDRESAMWSRDALQRVLDDVMASPGVGHIHIVGHSIGTMLTMEALRQLATHRDDAAAEKIGSIVFASPDIDMDVFKSSVERVGPITSSKITVITATNDRALAVSGLLAGGISRVGAAEKAELEGLGLRVIDASENSWGIINHDLFLSNAKVRQVIRNIIDGRPGLGA